jgi:tetratricopeptide (TPR) repeat protein/transcriptional regulator with XRE-family HTH domain
MFGDDLMGRRRRLSLSQEDLARKAGVDVKTLRSIETGRSRPRPSTVRLLADALELDGNERDRFLATAVGDRPRRLSTAPAQLPLDVAGFSGRETQLDHLDKLLDRLAEVKPGPPAVVTVWGTAGVGKTALAVHWAHRVRHRFSDGQLYVDLRGFDPTGTVVSPDDAIRWFLDALADPAQRIPADVNAQAALYRTLLVDKRMLIVLDNARTADQVRPLLPGTPDCLVIITSRNQLPSLVAVAGAQPLPLDQLAPAEGRQLLVNRLGADRVHAEPDAVDDIIDRCAGLPLALVIVVARAVTEPNTRLAWLAAQLREEPNRLNALTTADTTTIDIRAVLSWSYEALSPEAARLFRLLSLHPGPDVSATAAASLAGLALARVYPHLAELTRANLLVESTPGRYRFHDLLRAYAAERVELDETADQRRGALERILSHYLHTAYAAALLLYPGREPVALQPPGARVTIDEFTDLDEANAWLAIEHAALVAMIDHAGAARFDQQTWQLAWILYDYLDRRGHWQDWILTQQAAVAAAQRLGDPLRQARAHRLLGRAYAQVGRIDDAHAQLRQALDLFGQRDDHVGQAHTHTSLAVMLGRHQHHHEALDHARQALDLYRAMDHPSGQAQALNAIGWLHVTLRDYHQAREVCQQALTIFTQLDDRPGQAATWDSLGYAHHHLGEHTEATACYESALAVVRELGDRYEEAEVLNHLATTHQAAGRLDATRKTWQQALAILEELKHPDASQIRAQLTALDG